MLEYNVGDKVRVRDDLSCEMFNVIDEMTDLKGKIVTIESIKENGYYNLKEDDDKYAWNDYMFVPIKKENEEEEDVVNHPSHYCDSKIEVMDYIEDKGLNFARGNVIKYVSRAGKKYKDKEIEDLRKAAWYLNREIQRLEKLKENNQ